MKNNYQTPIKNCPALYNKEELSTHFNLGYRYKLHEINKISEKMGYTNTGNLFVRLGHIGHSIDKDIQKAVKYLNSAAPISEDNSHNIKASSRIYDVNAERKTQLCVNGNAEDLLKVQKPKFVIKTKILGDNLNMDHTSLKACRYISNNIHVESNEKYDKNDKITEIGSPHRFLNFSPQINKNVKFDSIFTRKNEEMSSFGRNSNFLKLASVLEIKEQDKNLTKSSSEIKTLTDNSENNCRMDTKKITKKLDQNNFTEKIMTISRFKLENPSLKIARYDEEEKHSNLNENFDQNRNQNKRRRIKNFPNSNPDNIKYSTNFNFPPRINNEIMFVDGEKNKTHFSNFSKNESKRNTMKSTFLKENKKDIEMSDYDTTFKQINMYNVSQYKNEKMKKFYGELDYNCKRLESIDFKIKSELNKAYKICDVFEKKMNK